MAFWAAGVIVGFDWIENRHNIPFMPAVCLLAGLGAIWLGMLLLIRRSCLYSLPLLTGTTFMLVGAICAAMDALSVPFIAWTPLSDLSLPLALTGGAILLWNACSALKVMRRLVVLSPIFIFLFAYVCYVSTDPTPRWRHHYASIPQDGTRLAQRFTLWTGKIVKAAVLLDFEMMDRTANLTVRLNGTVIAETMETAHSRYPNDVNSPDPASVRDTWRLYAAGQRPLDKWPQWWQIEFDPKLLTGPNAQIEISLARSAPALRIGIYNGEESGAFIGPSVSRTSIYRWLTTGDWRFWESFPTTGTIEGAILLQDQNISRPYGATLGIRLITEDRSGNIALY
jgi:hypothetical protein